ncbi:filamentous haemagglutinin family protein [Bradyrhizobium sp. Ai1a-2]|uniref:filamentous haemagglutinin family protein n=1 Tax=Bradyrhizobium sp. Ai1a-2 TaxID=196490 RepID=UPI0004206245|nr:filamentous haemagglutinin family protein [Bradyrhizobium sp. Ai1a-2]
MSMIQTAKKSSKADLKAQRVPGPTAASYFSPLSTRRGRDRFAFLAGVSVTALLMTTLDAYARPLGGQAPTPSAAAIAAAQSAQQEAARAASQSSDGLRRATLAIQAQQASQQAARDAARAAASASSVPNGLGAGGLQRALGAAPGTDLWRGANLPTQFTEGDRVKVDVEQTQQKAILTWDTFNVGARTDLRFHQQGNRDWVALNRVLGADGRPSQILGSIKADGSVYVINQNGIIFGGGSQINVGALIASTAKITNEQFLSGIYSSGSGSGSGSGSNWTPSFTDAAEFLNNGAGGGVVKVEAGAQIETHAPASVTSSGGFVLLMGGQVVNAGSITTPNGQTQLAAGDNFVLRRGYGTEANQFSTTRGNEIAPLFDAGTLAGLVRNDGSIFSPQGDITLAGRTIEQNAILVASTSVNTRGTIHLLNSATDTRGSIRLGPGSVTTIIPELESRETALNSQRDGLIDASEAANLLRATTPLGIFNNLSTLADRLDQSRIEIVTGGQVIFEGGTTPGAGSLTIAQGGQVAVSAGGRVFTETGATIDVSGVRDVSLAMSSNNILVNIQGNELRDSPVNRDKDYLKNQDVWVDIRDLIFVPAGTGGYDTDRYYTPGGLLEVGGHLANTAHTIGEWVALGGTITLSAPEVIAKQGSVFNISGGSIRYEAGYIRTSNFLGPDGRLYNINDARADMTFYGLGQGFVREHERWNVTEVWTSPFGKGRESVRWEEGYTVGRDAGQLILSTPTAIFEADILADVVQGERQVSARPTDIADGYKLSQTQVAQAGQLLVGSYGALGRMGIHDSAIVIGGVEDITRSLDASSVLPASRSNTLWLDASRLNDQRLGGLDLATGGSIAIDSGLALADGGSLDLTAPVIDIRANVTVRGGSVTASNQLVTFEDRGGVLATRTTDLSRDGVASVTLHSGATIDARGIWTNAQLDPSHLSGLAFADGGDVTLRSTGDVTLETGSRIDTSSGAAILANGKTKAGKGGDLSVLAGFNGGRGNLTLDGAITGYGVEGGGALSLSTAGLVVIGDASYEIGETLPAGSVTPADVTLTEALLIRAGSPLPGAYSQTFTTVAAGAALPTDVPIPTTTVAAEWVVPAGAVSIAYIRPGTSAVIAAPPGTVVPAGSTVRGYSTQTPILPGGYVLPANAFPSGLRLTAPQLVTYMPGMPAPVDVTIAAGTVIRAGTLLPAAARIAPLATLHLADDILSRGFSKYSINGQSGLLVASGANVAPVMPIYRFGSAVTAAPTGGDPSDVLSLWLPDIYMPDPVKGKLIERGGVDLELLSGQGNSFTTILTGGGVTIGTAASITVDPGHKVEIASGGQITVDGTITAHGGEIAILNRVSRVTEEPGGLSVWIGKNARLDASARAVTATDVRGQIYGVVPNGGTVILGSRGGADELDANAYKSTEAYVVVRDGAVIDVSGTSAQLDLLTVGTGGQSTITRRTIASNGGSIVLASYQGIYNDGMLLARAGGAGASGGTLSINLEAPMYSQNPGEVKSSRILAGRALHIAQDKQASALPADLIAGAAHNDLRQGYANLSADEVAAGGFDNLSLFARTAIVFDGDVNLSAGRSIVLRTSGLYNSVGGGHATVSAPYVAFDGQFVLQAGLNRVLPSILPAYPTTGMLTVEGGLIDIVNRMNAHVAKLTLDSDSDVRFLAYNRTSTGSTNGDMTMIASAGDLDLIARRIYPTTAARVQLYAGTAIDVTGSPMVAFGASNTSTITIGRHDNAPVATPYSVFGVLNLSAGTIRQGGNLLAPLGAISLVAATPDMVTQGLVEFLPGSLTSVSAKGLVIPYGGTVDGVSFTVDGREPLSYDLLTGTVVKDADGNYVINSRSGRLGITVTGTNVVSHPDSVLDLSGGGALTGAGFVSGRGGSVDVLVNALADANPGYDFSSSGNPVYAIVPGVAIAPPAGGYSTAWTGAVPGMGEQITIPAGVPGLPAGTYTLLPANYALLPGAYRVELGARGTTGFAAAQSLPNGSYLTSTTRGVANTSIVDSLSTAAIVTPGVTLRTYSQYNEQSYEAFQLAQAATFGMARPLLSIDGKFLTLNLATLQAGSAARVESALVFEGVADFAPAEGGYGGTLSVSAGGGSARSYNTDIVITGKGSTTARSGSVTTIAASEIADIGAHNLYIGSAPASQYAVDTPVFNITVNDGLARTVTLEDGVTLSGSQVIITANQGITVRSGASVNTLGHGLMAPDTVASGILFSAPTMLAVSNGSIALDPTRSTTSLITLEDRSSLYSEGSIAFTAGHGVVLQDGARFGTRDLELALPYINIGTAGQLAAAAAAGILPGGLSLDQALLDRLVQGDPQTGAPGMKNLILSAANSINFYGSVNLSTLDASGKSVLESFVLSTPAIYGHGGASDSVTLTTDRLVWSSRSLRTGTTNDGQPIYSPAVPGAIIANGPGTGHGVFNVDAREIVFGYLEQARSFNTLKFDRLMLGFETVNLNASDRITSNNTNTLAVWRTGPSPTADFDPTTYRGEQATLNLVTPLLTGDNGSTLSVYAGGRLNVRAPDGVSPANTATVNTLGATLNLQSVYSLVDIDTAIALPSGKLSVTSGFNIEIGDHARFDLSGRAIPFKDVTKYSWGGDIALESGDYGSIYIRHGAIFDVSAVNNDAGSITLVTADTTGGGGHIVFSSGDDRIPVSLDDMFRGSATEGYKSSSFKLNAHYISTGLADREAWSHSKSFARINRALNAGGFFETREFTIKERDLTIGDEVRAHNVVVSVDNGNLTVNGRIDASGKTPGSIRLSAKDDLTLASTAVLDVRGTELQTDSDGAVIEAKNRGSIELTTTRGWLRLAGGATLDLRSPDGAARGKIALNARRTSETGGDVWVDAAGPLAIRGAKEIALNAFWSYSPADADGTIVQDNGSGNPLNAQGELGLVQIAWLNDFFTFAARDNADLLNRIAGLAAQGDVFHLRAGVEILGGHTSDGKLTIKGDLDLAQMRTYGINQNSDTEAPAEPGSLVIRAPGNLTVNGSVSDGFDLTVDVPTYGRTLETDKTLTVAWTADRSGLVIGANSQIPNSGSLNFDVVAGTGTRLTKGAVTTAEAVVSSASVTLPLNTVITANVYDSQGNLKWAAGTVLSSSVAANRQLRSGDRISSGFAVPTAAAANILVVGMTIAAGTDLSMFQFAANPYIQIQETTLSAGDLLPAGTYLTSLAEAAKLVAGAKPLAAGTESWSIRMVAGADRQSADTRAVRTLTQLGGSGNMVLSNPINDMSGRILPNVIRTGTGDLDLIAGRDLSQDSPFGVYTAGTQINVGGAYSGVTSQGGYFTEGGGDLTITAGRNLTGYAYVDNPSSPSQNNYSVGNWLVRQGDAETPAAWGIRFGAFGGPNGNLFFGFSGFGALGGGNLSVDVGGDAGALGAVTNPSGQIYASTGLVFAVGGSGRVTSVTKTPDGVVTGGTLVQTGGGDLSVDIGGRLNPFTTPNSLAPDDLYGSFTNVRGDIAVQAGAIGSVLLAYGVGAPNDPRAADLYRATRLQTDGGVGGPVVVIGDGSASLRARGDLVFGGAGDPGMIYPIGVSGSGPAFSLWRSDSAITLFSAGGNMVPLDVSQYDGQNKRWGSEEQTNRAMLPPIFEAVAAHGSLYWAGSQRIELAPSRDGYLELLAGDSIYAAAFRVANINTISAAAWNVSGAQADPNSIPNPFRPGSSNSYFQFQPDTVTTNLHAGDNKLIRVYALTGDIVNFTLGDPTPQFVNGEYLPRYRAAMPARIYAGRDIVNFGKNAYRSQFADAEFKDTPSLILNNDASDISIIEAGRDILYAQVQVGGPGSLEVIAGRNLYLGDKGSIVSIGALAAGDTRPGASILMQAGAGPNGPNYASLWAYLDPVNLAVVGTPLADQPGKVAKTYERELMAWLAERYGFAASTVADAHADFTALAPEQQAIFLRQVYFAELKASGREYNDRESARFQSYLRGRQAIAALFPEEGANGNPITYGGDITIFGGSGVRTLYGGGIQMLTPGGQQVVGVEGQVPPASSGLITQGQGDIALYSKGSILLGLSRIMTTFGGDVLGWSAEGDINAGRGAKTTIVYTPARRVYDDYGMVTLSPAVPGSGAGIASRSSVPGVPGGSIDLIAPLGTIDAGEAGIRSGADVNLAALQIVNAANIQAQGNVTGVPTVQAPPVAALASSSNMTAATQQAQPAAPSTSDRPSIIIVEFLGFGGGDGGPNGDQRRKDDERSSLEPHDYQPDSRFQVVGNGDLTEEQKKKLTADERGKL